MSSHSLLSRIVFVSLLTGLIACSDGGPATRDTGTGDSAPAQPATAGSTVDTAKHAASDSAALPTPATLSPAPPDLAADTIPLHGPNGEQTRYGIETGRIVLKYTGDSRGERRVTFDSYGLRERRDENVGPVKETKSGLLNSIIMITTPEEQAYADVRTKQGWRTKNTGFQRYIAAGAGKTMSLGDLIMRESGAEVLPDTTINGYHCKVLRKKVKGMTVTNWFWRGIMIREQIWSPADTMHYILEPVEISPNIHVPDSLFKFPAGYKISEYTGK